MEILGTKGLMWISRVLENSVWGLEKSWKSPGNLFLKKGANPVKGKRKSLFVEGWKFPPKKSSHRKNAQTFCCKSSMAQGCGDRTHFHLISEPGLTLHTSIFIMIFDIRSCTSIFIMCPQCCLWWKLRLILLGWCLYTKLGMRSHYTTMFFFFRKIKQFF